MRTSESEVTPSKWCFRWPRPAPPGWAISGALGSKTQWVQVQLRSIVQFTYNIQFWGLGGWGVGALVPLAGRAFQAVYETVCVWGGV